MVFFLIQLIKMTTSAYVTGQNYIQVKDSILTQVDSQFPLSGDKGKWESTKVKSFNQNLILTCNTTLEHEYYFQS